MFNGVFVEFDEAIEACGLEKIKTFGDAYMVASGVPNVSPVHAKQLLLLGQDLCKILKKFNEDNNYVFFTAFW